MTRISRFRVPLLLLTVTGIVIGVWGALQGEREALRDGFLREIEETAGRQLEQSIETSGRMLAAYAADYSHWDETANYVLTKDPQWATVNLEGTLGTFQASAHWVLDRRFQLIRAEFADGEAGLAVPPLDAARLEALTAQDLFFHCFTRDARGLLEIRCAPIEFQATERGTDPVGWFLVARRWDETILSELGTAAAAQVLLVPTDSRSRDVSEGTRKDRIQIRHPLPGPDGQALADLRMIRVVPFAVALNETQRRTRLGLLLLLGPLLAVSAALMWWWVDRPLTELEDLLRIGRADDLKTWALRNRDHAGVARAATYLIERHGADELRLTPDGLKRCLDALPVELMVKDEQGRLLYLNLPAESRLGIDRSLAVGRSEDDLLEMGVACRHLELDREAFHSDGPLVREETSGERWAWMARARVATGAEPKLAICAIDLTDRRAAEVRLGAERDFLATILAELPRPVWVRDWTGRVLYANPAAQELDQRRPPAAAEETTGSEARRARDWQDVVVRRRSMVREELYSDPSGSPLSARVWTGPLQSPGGEVQVVELLLDPEPDGRDHARAA
ncbi:MAG: PAS domain-containing protein [Candidatus Eisenbacteria bacterium]|nr:PAS domain-containing protein [Candidatus Eisenbacteria bacterium]